MSTPTVLFCTASVGSGHNRAAEAVACQFKHSQTVDVLCHVPKWFVRMYRNGYFFAVKHFPKIVGWCYNSSDGRGGPFSGIVACAEDWVTKKFRKEVLNRNPSIVVSTHFLTSGVLGRMRLRGELRVPMVTVVTDDHPHTIWLHGGADCICVANHTAATTAIKQGCLPSKICVTGIPIHPQFETLKSESSETPTVLVSGGGAGIGEIENTVRSLVAIQHTVNIFVVCGNNEKLKASLSAVKCGRLRIVGYTDYMHLLMQRADLLVCKPGGLTTTEAIASGLPMVLMRPIPGQEERNARVLVESGAAVLALTPTETAKTVHSILSSPQAIARMRASTRALAVSHSALNVAEQVQRLLNR